MQTLTKVHVGVDVSKATLDICVHSVGDEFQVMNTKKGIMSLQKRLAKYDVINIACESTGGYENLMLTMLNNAGYSTIRIDPRRIKGWSAAQGNKVKTDKRDAAIIASFTAQIYPHAVFQRNKENSSLILLNNRHQFLTKHIAMEKNNLQNPLCNEDIKESITRTLHFLDQELIAIAKKIELLVCDNVSMQESIGLLISVPGIGERTAITLVTTLPELGQITDKEVAALVGVAPYTKQSGTYTGKAFTRDGRKRARKALFMAAFVGIQHNTRLKQFYDRLRDSGKTHMVALVAVMRKLIVILNAMLKSKTLWSPV